MKRKGLVFLAKPSVAFARHNHLDASLLAGMAEMTMYQTLQKILHRSAVIGGVVAASAAFTSTAVAWDGFIPSESQRNALQAEFLRLPGFPNSIEFIRDGAPQTANIAAYLGLDIRDQIRRIGFDWLDVREPVLVVDQAVRVPMQDRVVLPVIVGVRYRRPGMSPVDGTMLARLHITASQYSLVGLEYVGYRNNQARQAFGVQVLETVYGVDVDAFLRDVAGETLRRYYRQNFDKLEVLTDYLRGLRNLDVRAAPPR